jgi:hypothetical protein
LEKIIGHWLDPAVGAVSRTLDLGVRLEGRSAPRPNSREMLCPKCEAQLSLFATYENSAFIRLSKFALITLEFCPACSAESDGSAGANGFFPLLRQEAEALAEPALPEPVFFHASPTNEPSSEPEFRKWHPRIMRGKLGGRQLSIQPPLEAECERCSERLMFVASVDEGWAPAVLNFAGGFGYLFVCPSECSSESALFYWDSD